jgi:hypothetical protein
VAHRYTFPGLFSTVESRHDKAFNELSRDDCMPVFQIFKALSLINIGLAFYVAPTYGRIGINVSISIAFILLSIIFALLEIHKRRETSETAINNIFRDIIAESATYTANAEGRNKNYIISKEDKFLYIEETRKPPTATLGWSLPLVGSINALAERFFRRNRSSDEEEAPKRNKQKTRSSTE